MNASGWYVGVVVSFVSSLFTGTITTSATFEKSKSKLFVLISSGNFGAFGLSIDRAFLKSNTKLVVVLGARDKKSGAV